MSKSIYALMGDVSPEALEEDVVFDQNIGLLVTFAWMGGMGVLLTVALGLGLICLYTNQWHWFRRDLWFASCLLGAAYGIWHWCRHGRQAVIVNRHGIAVLNQGAAVQNCPWEQTTLAPGSRWWSSLPQLADQHGRPFPRPMPESSHPDRYLAQKAMSTRRLELVRQSTGSRTARAHRNRKAALLLGAGALGALGVGFLAPVFRAATEAGDFTSARFFWSLLGFAVSVSMALLFGLILGPAFLFDTATPKHEAPPTELKALVAAQRGRPAPVEMAEGTWYRYVSPKELGASEPWLGLAAMLLAIPALGGAVVAFKSYQGEPIKDGWLVILMCLPFLGAVGLVPRGLRLRRGLKCLYRRKRETLEVVRPDGRVEAMTVVRGPKLMRTANLSLGGVTWELQGQTRLAVDLRYLVPAEIPNLPQEVWK